MNSNPNEKIEGLQLTEESNLSGNDASTASIMVAFESREVTCDSRSNLINDEAYSEDSSKAALGRSSPPATFQRERQVTSELQKSKIIRKRIKDRRIRRLITLDETFTQRPKFPRYVVTFLGIEIDTKLNVITVERNKGENGNSSQN